VGAQTRIIATSSDRPMDMLPVPATDEMMLQVRRGRPYVSLDTDAVGGYVIRAASPLESSGGSGARVLIALYPVPQQLSRLADTVQRSYTQYANLVQLRGPLKIDVRADFVVRRPDVLDCRRVRRLLRRAAPGAAGAGFDAERAPSPRATTTPSCRCRRVMNWGSW